MPDCAPRPTIGIELAPAPAVAAHRHPLWRIHPVNIAVA